MSADVLSILRSKKTTLGFLVLALLAQMPHAAGLFYSISHVPPDGYWYISGWLHAWSYAIGLEMAILNFVLRGRRYIAWGFAGVSVLVNLGYYYETSMLYTAEGLFDPDWAWILRAVLVSIILPVAIALYSDDVSQEDTLVYRQVSPLVNILSNTQETTPEQIVYSEPPKKRQLILQDIAAGYTNQEIVKRHDAKISTVQSYRTQYNKSKNGHLRLSSEA